MHDVYDVMKMTSLDYINSLTETPWSIVYYCVYDTAVRFERVKRISERDFWIQRDFEREDNY